MRKILLGVISASMFIYAIPAKQATPACPTKSMLTGFISIGSIAGGMKAYPSCRVIYITN